MQSLLAVSGIITRRKARES